MCGLSGTFNALHEVADDVQSGEFLVISLHENPRCINIVRALKHRIARFRVLVPVSKRAAVDRAGLPACQRIPRAVPESSLLFSFRNAKIVFK